MPDTGRNQSNHFFPVLNDNCLAQDRPKELKQVSVKLPRNEASENIFTIFLAHL